MLRINEIFKSVQGEASYTGCVTTFIRMAGCPLRCVWCDTVYAQEVGEDDCEFVVEDLIYHLEKSMVGFLEPPVVCVCITGGEPLIQPFPELLALVRAILRKSIRVCIETNGSIVLPKPLWNCTFSVDYKLPSSGMEKHMRIQNLQQLRCIDDIKFVIGTEEDWERFEQINKTLVKSLRGKVGPTIYIQPALESADLSKMREKGIWLAEKLLNSKIKAKLSLQMHKVLWGDERGK